MEEMLAKRYFDVEFSVSIYFIKCIFYIMIHGSYLVES